MKQKWKLNVKDLRISKKQMGFMDGGNTGSSDSPYGVYRKG